MLQQPHINSKFKWFDDLFENTLKALINFNTTMVFQNEHINVDKQRQYKEAFKEMMKTSTH